MKVQVIKKQDIIDAMHQVKSVHSCATCLAHLNAIKEHQKRGHKDENKT